MWRATLTYITILIIGAVALWLVLLQGPRLQAPPDLSGPWSLREDPQGPHEVRAVVEQSGRFIRFSFDGAPPVEYALQPRTDPLRLHGPDTLLFHRAEDGSGRFDRLERLAADETSAPLASYTLHRAADDPGRPVSPGAPREGKSHSVLLLIAQLAVIILISRAVGGLMTYIRQPRVVGEMMAGIMLGPSLLGLFFPGASAALFPQASIPVLGMLAQLGVIFFLFVIGLELSPKLLRDRGHAAVVISHVSIVAPFILGAGLAIFLYDRLFSDTPQMRFSAVAMFMGAAMSITAFPVLARILTERNLHKTNVGAVAITCAAVDDVSAWCMLAFVISFARAEGLGDAVATTALSAAYVAAMLFLVRPFLRRIETLYDRQGRLTLGVLAVLILVVLSSALATEWIGIHALFGAFMAGAIMPKGARFVRDVTTQIEPFTLVVLLPIFFAFTGLRTRIDLLNSAELWIYTGLIVLVACIGKFGGSTIAALSCGLKWRDASAIGILMNTRGLMELVILSIGRELGVISDAVFTMMVVMALVTTFLTTPVLDVIYPERLRKVSAPAPGKRGRHDAILIPVSLARSGRSLVRMADLITGPENDSRRLVGLHLSRPDQHKLDPATGGLHNTQDPLDALSQNAEQAGIAIEPLSFVTTNPSADIVRVANDSGVGLVLMGFHKPVIGTTMLGGTVHRVMQEASADVAVLIDRGLPDQIGSILIPYMGSTHDRFALELAGAIARHSGAAITVLHVVPPDNRPDDPEARPSARSAVEKTLSDPTQPLPVTFKVIPTNDPIDVVIEQCRPFDLVIVGVTEQWGLVSQLFGWRTERIARDCPTSMLLVRRSAKPGQHAEQTP